jgi:hypothetical protein
MTLIKINWRSKRCKRRAKEAENRKRDILELTEDEKFLYCLSMNYIRPQATSY